MNMRTSDSDSLPNQRSSRIARLRAYQPDCPHWVGVDEIIRSWMESSSGVSLTSQDEWDCRYNLFLEDLRDGLFEEDGHSMLLLLDVGTRPERMTPAALEEHLPQGLSRHQHAILRRFILKQCWAPLHLYVRFLDHHDLQLPARFKALWRREQRRRTANVTGERTKRGRKPVISQRVSEEMLHNLKIGRISPEELGRTKQIALEAQYNCGRSTAIKARGIALSKFAEIQLPAIPTRKN